MIELRLWRSFLALAEELNFRRAAKRLSISQPALTKQIQDLEARLGVALFRREAHGVEPTSATVACMDRARALIDASVELEAEFREAQRAAEDHIRLGMPEFFFRSFLLSVLAAMRAQHPQAKVSMVEVNTFETAGAVADGKIDLGVARVPVTEQNLVARAFRRGHWMLIMPEGHRLAAKGDLTPADLGDDPLIFFVRRLNPELYDAIISAIEAGAQRAEIAYHTQDPMIGVELAANGIGLCLSVSYAVGELPAGLVMRPVNGFGHAPMLDLVWRHDRMTPMLRALIDAFLSNKDAISG